MRGGRSDFLDLFVYFLGQCPKVTTTLLGRRINKNYGLHILSKIEILGTYKSKAAKTKTHEQIQP